MSHFIRVALIVLILLGAFFVWRQMSVSPQTTPPVEVPVVVENGEEAFTSERGVSLFVTLPLKNSLVTSPLKVTGTAPGTWYFEASFPIIIVNWDGLIIAQGYATAQTDWMTPDQVPFEGTIEFTDILPLTKEIEDPNSLQSFMKKGALILQKDNPSGLPENDDALEIPILFAQ
ncbi:MAG: hypothetical protein UT30_C0019G0030 [Candidatus Uhrbacteria bacterium GW2011_GWF2_39_13]|uniref:Bacterial spore germination immunoglobulin-like domain-containing protein n=1 Tax=Candidatus Uhrbacteria bacterium GW2011_GWF2_39_13 TaxID=1618995 RepID=A0A0G0MIB9_9BACT|nr:MAG: hypothetical protein UT30_C0019G0030 [Candidatus Uhrbacteria bacterium GW2011_GWF2_39_13]HAU66203.1 hypothetical protein [Candidatus Uhrbacteria bacterium]